MQIFVVVRETKDEEGRPIQELKSIRLGKRKAKLAARNLREACINQKFKVLTKQIRK